MPISSIKHPVRHSPAFVLDLDRVQHNFQVLEALRQASGCKVLYSMKALPLSALLSALKGLIDGISVSSLFEARLAREIFVDEASLHLTTPGLRSDEFAELARLCSHISFNSLSQYQTLNKGRASYSKGLRVNPKRSFADDIRYDPCRPHSKLGVDIAELYNGLPPDIDGLHFHTVFGRTDFQPVLDTVAKLGPVLKKRPLKWLNLGGGYLYNDIVDLNPLTDLIDRLKTDFALEIYLEPGKGLVGNAGFLVSTVLDKFDSDGKTVLILDTSVNHHPKVFEYQIKPALLEENERGGQSAVLAGCSCLAGDLFGEYRFEQIPNIGDKLVFANIGAYSLIKANRFNGYALPAVYLWQNGELRLCKTDEFADYRRQWFV